MSIEVKVPQLPESVSDATLVSWRKTPGDTVQRDETLVDLETDKVVLEVPAPVSGVIKEILIADGTTVTSGQLLAVIIEGEGAEKSAPLPVKPIPDALPENAPVSGNTAPGSNAGKLSPAVRRLLEENDVDPKQITGSGRDGRILKADVLSFLEQAVHPEEQLEVAGGDEMPDLPGASPEMAADPSSQRLDERVPMSRLRARIAERMVEAQQTSAMLTTFNEVDMSSVISLRKKHKEAFAEKHGVGLGFMSFFVKAVVDALGKFPAVNASIEGNEIVYHNYFDIGIAVSSERGLMVPVIRNADMLSFAGVEGTIREYGAKARDGKISMEELTGGTFTITNGGVFGSMLSTPILNPPQSGILGMHNIQERAMVIDGEIVVRPVMYVALTYDHRIIDGREAVQFLVSVKESLENPGRLLLQI